MFLGSISNSALRGQMSTSLKLRVTTTGCSDCWPGPFNPQNLYTIGHTYECISIFKEASFKCRDAAPLLKQTHSVLYFWQLKSKQILCWRGWVTRIHTCGVREACRRQLVRLGMVCGCVLRLSAFPSTPGGDTKFTASFHMEYQSQCSFIIFMLLPGTWRSSP